MTIEQDSSIDNKNENYADYPMTEIEIPHEHDVLSGRGGGTNTHKGNTHWRMLVTANKELYVSLPKRQKQLLSKSIVEAVRSQSPPGRFLKQDKAKKTWSDIGDACATEKTSQALREGAKQVRQEMAKRGDLPPDAAAEAVASPQRSTNTGNGEAEAEGPGISIVSITACSSGSSPTPDEAASSKPPAFVETKTDQEHADRESCEQPPTHSARDFMAPPPVDGGLRSSSSDPVSRATQLEQDFEVAMVGNGALEEKGVSFGSVSMAPSVLDTPMGLESQGVSFGSALTMPSTQMEPGVTSFGSAMSYTTTHTGPSAEPLSGGLEPGISLGSISMTSVDQQRLKESLIMMPHPREELPTLLQQPRSTANLLECSDSEDEDDDRFQHHYASLPKRFDTAHNAPMPLPIDRDVSNVSSIARFLSGAFTDQTELERKQTTGSYVEPVELVYGFSGFSLDGASGITNDNVAAVPPPPPPVTHQPMETITDEEKLAMHLSLQESKARETMGEKR